ncbi:MAG: helix-turn-helix domain-containing protein [Aristaeellaceae bacterium]
MDYKDLGNRVRTVRRQHSLTQEQLAEKVGISASFLGHIERGTRVASLETLVAICNTLNVTPEYLLSASLHTFENRMPDGLSEHERATLSEFLRLAQDTVRNWDR